MPIIARDMSLSAKKQQEAITLGAVATGVTSLLEIVPFNAILQGVNVAAFGISGSPVYSLAALRFAGGLTSIPLGVTLSATAYGTSGAIGFSIPGPGISLIAGDVLLLTSGGANSSIAGGIFSIILSPTADIAVYQNSVG